MPPGDDKKIEQPELSAALAQDVTDTSLNYLETKLTDEQKTTEELIALGGNVDTEQLYANEIVGKKTTRNDIITRFSTSELQAQTISQIEQSGNTELQAQLAALMSGGIGFTLLGRLRKGVIDSSKHDITTTPFPSDKIAEIMKKAEELGLQNITTVEQLTTIAKTLGIDLGPQQVFLTFLKQDTPLSKELATIYLPQISAKMHTSMQIFLTSYTPGEKKKSEMGSISQLMYTKDDFKRKNSDGTRNTDNVKSFAGKTMVVGGAVGLVVKGCQWLFGSKKEKKKKKGWFGRAMDGVWKFLMIGGGATVGHRLITGERRRGTDGEVDSGTSGSLPTQKEADDFLKEFTPEQQAAYNGAAQAINEMYTTNAGIDPTGSSVDTDIFGESRFEQGKEGGNAMGLVVAMIDKRHGTVQNITDTVTVYKELFGKNIHEAIDWARDYAKDAILNIFGVAAGMISNHLAQRILGCTSKEQLKAELEKNPQIADKYDEALRKYLKVISYFQYKQQQLPGAIARQHLLTTDTSFSQLTEEDQNDKIDDLLNDSEFYKSTIDPLLKQFNQAPLLSKEGTVGAIQLLKQYNILDGTLIPSDKKKLEQITKEHDELINKDNEGDVFTAMQESLQTGNQEQAKKELATLQENLQEHLETQGYASRWSTYTPILSALDTDEQTRKRLFSKCGFDEIGAIHTQKLQDLKNKEQLTVADIQEAKQTVNNYFAAVKELQLTNIGITGIFEENGELIIDIGHTFLQTGESIANGLRLTINKKYLTEGMLSGLLTSADGAAQLLGGLASAGVLAIGVSVVTYPIRLVAYPFRVISRLGSFRPPPKFPSSGIGKIRQFGSWTLRKGAQLGPKNTLVRTRGLTSKYRSNAGLLKADLANGRITLDEALRLAKRIGSGDFLLNSNKLRSVDDLLRRGFGLTDQAHIDVLKINRDAPRRKTIMNKEFTGKRYAPRQRLQRARRDKWFDASKLQTYITLNHNILSRSVGIEQEFFKTMLANSKDEKLLGTLLKESFPSKLMHLHTTKKIDLLEIAKLLGRHGLGAQLPTGKTHLGLLTEIIEHGLTTGKITNMHTFVGNLLRRRPTITANARSGAEAFAWIEKGLRLDMNKTKFERGWNQSKELLQNIITQLEKVRQNPRLTTAYQKTVGTLLENCKLALHEFNPQSAQKVGAWVQAGKARVGQIPSEIINIFKVLRASPALNIVVKVIGRALAVGAVVIDVLDLQATNAKLDAYDLPNAQRKASLQQESRVKTGLVYAEGATIAAWGATSIYTLAVGVNVVPGAGQIASAILLGAGVIYQGASTYYEVDQKWKMNESDFFLEASQCALTTKQNLIAAIAYERGQTWSLKQGFYSFIHNFGGISPIMAYMVSVKSLEQKLTREQYIAAGIKALLMLDELSSDPILRKEVLEGAGKKPISPETSQELKSRIDRRYTAMTRMYGTPPISEQETKQNTGITALNRKIHASKRRSRTDTPPAREQWEKEVSSDPRYPALKQKFSSHHTDLVTYRANQQQISSWANAEAEPMKTQLINNISYFDEFMRYQSYLYHGAPTHQDQRTAEKAKFIFPQTPQFNETAVDMQQVVAFFATRERKSTALANTYQQTTDQFEKEYQISGNLGQQVLYRLCNEIYGYTGPNLLREDTSNKQGGILGYLTDRTTPDGFDTEYTTGIYYDLDDNMLKVNEAGAFSKDNKLCLATPEALASETTVRKLATELDRHDIFETKTSLGEEMLNRELADRMKRIVHEELRRRGPEGKKQVTSELAAFRKTYGTKVQLPAELHSKAIRAGIEVSKTIPVE